MSGALIAHWWRIIFCGLGVFFILFSLIYYVRGRARQGTAGRTWQKTTATIVSASVKEYDQVMGAPGANWLVVKAGTTYIPEVEYSYDVNGARLGHRAFLNGRHFYTPEQCNAWLAKVQPGSKTDMWFDPEHPDDSALVITSPLIGATMIGLATGVGLIVAGLALAKSFLN